MDIATLLKSYNETFLKIQELLSSNNEWRNRYNKYAECIVNRTEKNVLMESQRKFAVPEPFHLYMPLSTVVNKCSKKRTVFELRFHGISIAEIYTINDIGDKSVSFKVNYQINVIDALAKSGLKQEVIELKEIVDKGVIDWDSCNEYARKFRKIFTKLESVVTKNNQLLKGQPEHDMESYLLDNFAEKLSKNKEIRFIQPVTMFTTRARYQMPTPIRASDVKKGVHTLKYSNYNGGGIDILARVESGRKTKLAVLELKDQNIDNEPPELAINQAIAYATFIRELLRSECGELWWKLFGFNSTIPSKLEIKAIIVMPNEINSATWFASKELAFKDSNDVITLGYIYRKNKNLPLIYDF